MIKNNKKIFNINELDDVFFNREKTLSNIFKNAQEDITIFDIGANIGQSLEEFQGYFPNSFIHCFEPDKNTFQKLVDNHSSPLFSTVVFNNIGVSNKEEELELYKYSNNTINSFLGIDKNTNVIKDNVYPQLNKSLDVETENCKVVSLDNYCLEKNRTNWLHSLYVSSDTYERLIKICS